MPTNMMDSFTRGYAFGDQMRERDRQNKMRELLKRTYVPPSTEPVSVPQMGEMGESYPNQIQTRNIPGRFDYNNAIAGLFSEGFGPEAFELQQKMEQNELSKLMANIKYQNALSGSERPSAIQVYEYWKGLPAGEQKSMLETMRSPTVLDLGGTKLVRGPAGAGGDSYAVTPRPEDMPDFKGAQAGAVDKAKAAAEKDLSKTKVESGLGAMGVKTELLDELIEDAKKQAGWSTTGFVGQKLQDVGGTAAHDLRETLATVKANIGFDKLQEMRANSPTGGALGNVSDRETQILQAVWGALQQSQSREQFIKNLDRVGKQVKESWARVMQAYEKDYGTPYTGSFGSPKAPDASPSKIPDGAKTATNPKTGQKAFSTDGKTWFDAATGKRL